MGRKSLQLILHVKQPPQLRIQPQALVCILCILLNCTPHAPPPPRGLRPLDPLFKARAEAHPRLLAVGSRWPG